MDHIARYEVVKQIGQGGMGTVYLAKDPAIGRRLAIKLLKEEFDENLRVRFEHEARVGQIEHGNIVTIYDVGVHDGRPFIAMSYIAGETLAEIIRRKAPMTVARKLMILEEICNGLHAAHKIGIVHRDMKPANVMVDSHGIVRILDFGIARLADEASRKTQDGTIMGTYNYMSPEQIAAKPLDHRSDIFAVGAILYEMLSYTRAFSGSLSGGLWYRLVHEPPQPLRDLCRNLDEDVERIVMRALEKDAANRYTDLDAMRREIAKARRRISPADVDTLLGEAERAFAAKDFEKALTQAREALALDPDHARAIDIAEQVNAAVEEAQNRRVEDAERKTDLTERLSDVQALFERRNFNDAVKGVDALLAEIPEGPAELRAAAEALLDRIEDAFTAHILEIERRRTTPADSADTEPVPMPANGIDQNRTRSVTDRTRSVPDDDEDDDAPTQVIERPRPPSPKNSS